jgi:protein translocase SecG subunit
MNFLGKVLPYAQIILAALLIAGVLLQQSGANVGGALGASDNFSSGFHTRRGFERTLFLATALIAILFIATTLIALKV